MSISLTQIAEGSVAWAATVNSNFAAIQIGVNGLSRSPCYTGDGHDGALTFDGTTTIVLADGTNLVPSSSVYTLVEDIYPSSMTVNAAVEVKLNGYRIICSGTITVNSGGTNGKITANGNDGSGITAGAATNRGSISGFGTAGGN